ncbi:formate dehydrogenase accessory sulfurtransferase FdhD [soil metagenome]
MESLRDLPSTQTLEIGRARGAVITQRRDTLAVEEPLEIRIAYGPELERIRKSISITMRTPGRDFELAVGFLFTEGILRERSHLISADFCGPTRNVVRVELAPQIDFDLKKLERHFYTSSSCGVCGKSSIEALRIQSAVFSDADDFKVSNDVIHRLPLKLREAQDIFDSTGGLHACAAFSSDGTLLDLREDVGRHNALDKLIGHAFLENRIPLRQQILLVSGRASFELVQKAAMAGFRFFAAVGAPSSLAVQLAKESGMTLLGFVRNDGFNIYCGGQRL